MSVERKEVVEQRESVSGIRDDGRKNTVSGDQSRLIDRPAEAYSRTAKGDGLLTRPKYIGGIKDSNVMLPGVYFSGTSFPKEPGG